MKKMFVAALFAALVAPALISCDDDTPKCHEVIYKVKTDSSESTTTVYIWASKDDLDDAIEKQKETLEKVDGVSVTVKSKKVNKQYESATTCTAANLPF